MCGCAEEPEKKRSRSRSNHDCKCGPKRSTRRDDTGPRPSYRFATAVALVKQARLSPNEAERLVNAWSRYVRYRMQEGKSPESTAEHLVRFERQQLARPFAGNGSQRDPQPRRNQRQNQNQNRSAKSSGETRISARGIPFRVCPRGTRIQTLLFPADLYTAAQAERWAREHGFRVRKLDETQNYVRIRQEPVDLFAKGSFRTIDLRGIERHGIRAVIGCPRFAVITGGRGRQRQRQQPEERRRVAAS